MGNNQSTKLTEQELAQYRRRDITDDEIQSIYGIFISYNPVNNKIKSQDVQEMYQSSFVKSQLDNSINGREYLTFDEFYEMYYAQKTELQKQFGAGIQFDAQEQNMATSCMLCPPSNTQST